MTAATTINVTAYAKVLSVYTILYNNRMLDMRLNYTASVLSLQRNVCINVGKPCNPLVKITNSKNSINYFIQDLFLLEQ